MTFPSSNVLAQNLLSESLTRARAADGNYISWREHIIDDPEIAGFALSGSDGLIMGDIDFLGTRGNSAPFDGVFWLEQIRSSDPRRNFQPARASESNEIALP